MWQSARLVFALYLNAVDRLSFTPLPNGNIKGWIFFAFACGVDTSAIKRRRLANPTLLARRVAGGQRRLPSKGRVLRCPILLLFCAFRLSSAHSYLPTRSHSGSSRVTLVALRAITAAPVIGGCARAARRLSTALRPSRCCLLPAGKIKEPRLKGLREEKDNQIHPIHAGATALIPRHILGDVSI